MRSLIPWHNSSQLRTTIKTIQESKLSTLKTMVNLGSELYMKAVVWVALCDCGPAHSLRACRPDSSKIFVDVGLNCHVEFTLDEALAFIDKKEDHLST
jgi:prefoldin subunit 5